MFFNYEILIVSGAVNVYSRALLMNMCYFTGANVSFVGYVRRRSFTEAVSGITYVMFNTLLLNVLRKLCFKVFNVYGKYVSITVIHSTGFVAVGEPCIYIGVKTAHRVDAFKICRYVLENIKKNAPIWKMEHCYTGEFKVRWLY